MRAVAVQTHQRDQFRFARMTAAKRSANQADQHQAARPPLDTPRWNTDLQAAAEKKPVASRSITEVSNPGQAGLQGYAGRGDRSPVERAKLNTRAIDHYGWKPQ